METPDWFLGRDYRDIEGAELFSGIDFPEREVIEDRSYLSFESLGMSMVLRDHIHVSTVQLHAAGHDGFGAYAGPLPDGVSFNMSRVAVRQRFGEPDEKGEPQRLPFLGESPAWDAYRRNGIRLHFDYAKDAGSIEQISVTRA